MHTRVMCLSAHIQCQDPKQMQLNLFMVDVECTFVLNYGTSGMSYSRIQKLYI